MHSVGLLLHRGGALFVERVSSNLLAHPGVLHRVRIKPGIPPSTTRCCSSSTWPPILGKPYTVGGAPESPPKWYDAEKDRLFILDAMGPVFRFHEGYKDRRLRAPSGEDTTILYGFINYFLGIMNCQPAPTHVLVVFDAPGATFRNDIAAKDLWHPDNIANFIENRHENVTTFRKKHSTAKRTPPTGREEIYPAYKGHRKQVDSVAIEGSLRVMEWLTSLGIKCLQVHGVEADDVCGTMTYRAIEEGMMAWLFSIDQDYFQLLQDNVFLFRGPFRKDQQSLFHLHTAERFTAEFQGLVPKQIIELKGLCGDTSDNIPGVVGIGPKTALGLVKEHMDVEGVIEAIKTGDLKVKKRYQTLGTEDGWNAARKSRELVEIQTRLQMPDVRFALDEARLVQPHSSAAFDTLKELNISYPVPRLEQLIQQWRTP